MVQARELGLAQLKSALRLRGVAADGIAQATDSLRLSSRYQVTLYSGIAGRGAVTTVITCPTADTWNGEFVPLRLGSPLSSDVDGSTAFSEIVPIPRMFVTLEAI